MKTVTWLSLAAALVMASACSSKKVTTVTPEVSTRPTLDGEHRGLVIVRDTNGDGKVVFRDSDGNGQVTIHDGDAEVSDSEMRNLSGDVRG